MRSNPQSALGSLVETVAPCRASKIPSNGWAACRAASISCVIFANAEAVTVPEGDAIALYTGNASYPLASAPSKNLVISLCAAEIVDYLPIAPNSERRISRNCRIRCVRFVNYLCDCNFHFVMSFGKQVNSLL